MDKLFFIVSAFLASALIYAQPQLQLETFTSGLSSPIHITNAGDERMFVCQQAGTIRILNADGSAITTPFLNITTRVRSTGNEQGLLGLAFHPDYANNGLFFVNYTRQTDGATVISKFSVDPNDPNLALANSEVILMIVSQPYSNHNGGTIAFGPDGYLYIGLGDGGSSGDPQNRAQNPATRLGKMLRIDVNDSTFTIPPDNPFVNDASTLDEIWAAGLRNPWRFSFDRMTGDLWNADVGQNNWEEVNFQSASSSGGENYGWKCYEGNVVYAAGSCNAQTTYTMPVFVYANNANNGCSVTGGNVYRGAMHRGLFGYYLVTDACSGNIWWIKEDNGNFTNALIADYFTSGAYSEFVGFGENNFGEHFLVRRTGGFIYKIKDTSDCRPVALVLQSDTVSICGQGDIQTLEALFHPALEYQWQLNGVDIPNAEEAVLEAAQEGVYSVVVTNPANACFSVSNTIIVEEHSLSSVSFSGLDTLYEVSDAAVALTGNPTGGVFSGAGISGNDFDPALAGVGVHTITYTYTDNNGCVTETSETVTVSLGTKAMAHSFIQTKIFPNPNNGNFQVMSSSNILSVSVLDLLGRKISQSQPINSLSFFSENNLDKGVFIIKIETQSGIAYEKIMVQ